MLNDTSADNDHFSGHFLERKRESQADNLLVLYFDSTTGGRRNLGPGSSDDILLFHGGLAALVKLHWYDVRRHRGGSFDDSRPCLALGETLHVTILRLEDLREIQFEVFDWRRPFF